MLYIYIFQSKVTGLIHRTILTEHNILKAYVAAGIKEEDAILFRYREIKGGN
jgi:hypothetical protein